MLKAEIGIEVIRCDERTLGYSINCAGKAERMFALLLLLKENQISSFYLADGKNRIRVMLGATSFDTNTQTLCLGKTEFMTLISMLSDVIQEKAFTGYHYDFECATQKDVVDLAFILN